jgi:hypothetical protein
MGGVERRGLDVTTAGGRQLAPTEATIDEVVRSKQ